MINTKEELFQTICNAAHLGTLGFFIGAGFSKAILNKNLRYRSYKWSELLEECCNKLNIDQSILNSYCSYPELATLICKKYSEINEIPYNEAVTIFKTKVCELTNAYPEQRKREQYRDWFKKIAPSWIVTTNYDTIIESVLGGEALPISPNGCFCNINRMTPVFHLHGICNEPDGIIITNEDYACMFRPNDYRQARLPFLIKESCVLMIGYGLGDINVLTAVDWANNVYRNNNEGYDFPIIQLVYTDDPKPEPYIEKDSVIIYEIESIETFFKELSEFMSGYMEEYNNKVSVVEYNISYLNNIEENNIMNFIKNKDNQRAILLDFFKSLEPEFGYAFNSFFQFIRVVMTKLDELSMPSGAFEAYNVKLCIIMDILTSIQLKKIPPSLFGMLANELNSVGYYVNPEGKHISGESYNATDSWGKYKYIIPENVIDALWRFVNSGRYDYNWLVKLLKSVSE